MNRLRTGLTLVVLVELALLEALLYEREVPPAANENAVPELPSFALACSRSAPEGFDELVRAAATEFGINPNVLAVTVYRESGCNAQALGSSGEISLAQVHPKVWTSTLVKEGIIVRAKDLWDPATNLRAGAYILSRLSTAAEGDTFEMFRRYNGSGPKARKYAREQLEALSSLVSLEPVAP